MKTTNIYTLTDPETKKVRYVGKANDISQRYKAHLNRARKHQTHKKNWINSLKKKGLKPIIEIIDVVPINEWQYWETYWISQLKAWGFNLVNHTYGGDGCTFANQTSFKIGDGTKKVIAFNSNYDIKYEFNSATIASREFNLNRKTISSCANPNNPSKTIKNLAWFYIDDIKHLNNLELKKQIDERFVIKKVNNSGQFKKGCKGINSKQVLMYDLDWNFIKSFESAREAAKHIGVAGGSIQYACTKSKTNKCKNYKFKYEKNT